MKYSRRTPADLRMKIVREYLTGNSSYRELGDKYGISKPDTIRNWVSRFQSSENLLPLQPQTVISEEMARKESNQSSDEKSALVQRIRELEKRLHYAELQNLALNTMIDIAEEQGIEIRKKSGAKQ